MRSFDDFKRHTQLKESRELNDDRSEELAEYFELEKNSVLEMYRHYNIEKTKRIPSDLFIDQSHPSVIRSYLDPDFHKQSLTRLMLHYNRFSLAYRVITALCRDLGSEYLNGMTFIDYGCGAADYALGFAQHGVLPVLVDLKGGPVEFASYRFRLRNIRHETIAITEDIEYPTLPHADIINATEVLEHVADPPFLIRNFADALPVGGYFTFSDYPMKAKTIGGSHLQSAASKREDAFDVLHQKFDQVWADPAVGYLYKRR